MELTSIECKKMIRNDIIILIVSAIAFAFGYIGLVVTNEFSFILLLEGFVSGIILAGMVGIFFTLFLAIASDGEYFWAFIGAGVGELLLLLLINWIAEKITSNLANKNTVYMLVICVLFCAFFVFLVVHLRSTRKEYKEAIERESTMQKRQNAEENEWLIKQEVSQQEVNQQEVSQQEENEWLIK